MFNVLSRTPLPPPRSPSPPCSPPRLRLCSAPSPQPVCHRDAAHLASTHLKQRWPPSPCLSPHPSVDRYWSRSVGLFSFLVSDLPVSPFLALCPAPLSSHALPPLP
ncbi:hypothetical protein E2C01_017127 [Portunus trituberculatus]|uniref:Uncharacterized protein n=1 Tax=Portunus trituberculatus TaxID=210409 RepID=A0A5B7DSY8_PORTR|nr:hypothetical protein [Portunus trituberculatus]